MAPATAGLVMKPSVSTTINAPRIVPNWINPKARVRRSGSSSGPPPLPTTQNTRNTAIPAAPESRISVVIPAIRKATSPIAAVSMRRMRSASRPNANRERMPNPAAIDTSAAATTRETPTDS